MATKKKDLILKNDYSFDNNISHTERRIIPKNRQFFNCNTSNNDSTPQKESIIKKQQIKHNLINSQPKNTDKIFYHPINSSPNIFDKENLYNLFLLFQYYSSINKDKSITKKTLPSLIKGQISNIIKNNNLKNNNTIETESKKYNKENNLTKKTNNDCFINYGIINTNSFSAGKIENNNENTEENNKLLIKKKAIIKYPTFIKRQESLDYTKCDEENNENNDLQNKIFSICSNYFDNNSPNKIELNENTKISGNSSENFNLKNKKIKLNTNKTSTYEIKVNTKQKKVSSKSKNKNKNQELINKKMQELNEEILLFKEKTNKINLLKLEYEKLQQQLNKDIEQFKKEKEDFEKYKISELDKIQKEKNQYQVLNQKNKKDQIKKLNVRITELVKLVKEKDKELLKILDNCNKNHIEKPNKNNTNKTTETFPNYKIENSNIKQNNKLKKYITKSKNSACNPKTFRCSENNHLMKVHENRKTTNDFMNTSNSINTFLNSIGKFKTLDNNSNSNSIGKFNTIENKSNSTGKYKTIENCSNSHTIGKYNTLENNKNLTRSYFNNLQKSKNIFRKNIFLTNSINTNPNGLEKVSGIYKKINHKDKSDCNFSTNKVNDNKKDNIVNINNEIEDDKKKKEKNELNISQGFISENDEEIKTDNNEKNNDIEKNNENKIDPEKNKNNINNNSDILFSPRRIIKEISDINLKINEINTISNTQYNWSQKNKKEKAKLKLNLNSNLLKDKNSKKGTPLFSDRNNNALKTLKKNKLGIKPNIKNLIMTSEIFADYNTFTSGRTSHKKCPIYDVKKSIKKMEINPKIATKLKNETTTENYDFTIPKKYLNKEYKLLKNFESNDKKIKLFDNNKKEILFKSGVKKEIFDDGFQIVYFPNGDKKLNFPDEKKIYFFNDTKTVQTTYKDGTNVFKFNNNQIEKHFVDGSKYIIFPNGQKKYISKYGKEENLIANDDKKDCEIFLKRSNFDVSELLDRCDSEGKNKEVFLSYIDIEEDEENVLNKNK